MPQRVKIQPNGVPFFGRCRKINRNPCEKKVLFTVWLFTILLKGAKIGY